METLNGLRRVQSPVTGRKESRRALVFYTEVRESVLVAQTPHSQ